MKKTLLLAILLGFASSVCAGGIDPMFEKHINLIFKNFKSCDDGKRLADEFGGCLLRCADMLPGNGKNDCCSACIQQGYDTSIQCLEKKM